MTRLIDADALKEKICRSDVSTREKISNIIDNAPTVDTFTFDDMKKGINVGYKAGRLTEKWKRPQGKWIETNSNDENIICLFCKTEFNGDIKLICGGEDPKFCPDCGARMVGGSEDGKK